MKILFVTIGDKTKASSRYRVFNLLRPLKQRGIDVDVVSLEEANTTPFPKIGKLAFISKILTKSHQYDVVYIQKILFPKWFLELLQTTSDVIYDFDDAIYASHPWKENSNENRAAALNSVLEAVSVVITGNPNLSAYAEQYADQVFCLPTAIPRDPYQGIVNNQDQNHSINTKEVIGWIGNPENLWYLSNIESTIVEFLDLYERTELHIITANEGRTPPLSERSDVIYQEWSLENELRLLSKLDIAIRPLTNDEWTRSKGGFTSVIQCMALGIPVVVSPVGMLKDIITHTECGYFAECEEDWRVFLSRLVDKPEKRRHMGEKAFKRVEEKRFWVDQRVDDMIEVLSKLD